MELLTVYLSAIDEAHFKVIVQSSMGEAEADSRLSFFETADRWRTTLIKALEVNEFRASAFPQEVEQEWMAQQGWLSSDRQSFHPSLLARIGQAIYSSLFPAGGVRDLLQRAIAHAEGKETQLHIQLKFSAEVTKRNRLPDYPWELAHDGQTFLAHHQIRFSRYIAYLATVPKLPSVEKLNVLLVSSGASDEENGLPPLSKREQKAVFKGLEKAQEEDHIQVEVLEPASLNQLRVHLTEHQTHVFHFDGHGVFGKRCNKDACRTIHKDLSAKQCKRCGADLPEPQGYLLFETEEDEADYVSAIELGELLQKTGFGDQPNQRGGITVAVLSACKSGMALGGESVFNGLAQRLINHRLPAVVAMQYTVRVDGATQFAEQFYRSLGRKNSLATAISQGQEAMGAEGNQWYRPMLYLRWQDNEGGQLFAATEVAPEKRIGIPFQAPPLPSYYVDRPEVSQDLKARLLQPQSTNSSSTSTLMISAIHGLGAIGKSTLATALAHDPDIQAHFADGILWVTLGQKPNSLGLLQGWVQALGDYNFRVEDVESTSRHLQTLLREKATLLVVDDAWSTADTRFFVVGGTHCQVLITTRDSSIAEGLRANNYPLDVMSPEQAMQLIAQKLKQEFSCELQEQDREQAAVLAKAVGYLPLALELAVAQVADGTSWNGLIQDLQKEVARLKSFDRPGARDEQNEAELKRVSLTASLNLSIQRLPVDEREHFIWLGVLPEDGTINPKMTVTLWNLDDERDADDSLKYLRSKALLLPSVSLVDGTLTYRLHDLLHDLARNLLEAPQTPKRSGALAGLGLKLAQAQAELLESYRQKTQKHLWHTLPDDSYIHEHLIWHMEQAGWIREIHQMLAETAESGRNGWYETRENLHQTAGYLRDILRAWDLVEASRNPENLSEIIGLQCQYALIIATFNVLVRRVPIDLLVELVDKGIWLPEQGLTYAEKVKDPRRKAKTFVQLAALLDGSLKQQAITEALKVVETIQGAGNLKAADLADIKGILPLLPDSLLVKVFQMARSIHWDSDRSPALQVVIPYLPDNLLPSAFEAAQEIEEAHYRGSVLISLIPRFPDALAEALRNAHKSSEYIGGAFFEGVDKLVCKLAEPDSAILLRKAIQLIQTVEFEYESSRANILTALVPKLPSDLLQEAFQAAKVISDKSALIALIPKLPKTLMNEALQVAKEIDDASQRAQALLALSSEFPDVLNEVLQSAKLIDDHHSEILAKILTDIASRLSEPLLTEAAQMAREIQNPNHRAEALVALAFKLPDLLIYVLQTVPQIAFFHLKDRADFLATLASSLPSSLLLQALESVQEIQQAEYCSEALIALIPYLTEPLLPNARKIAESIISPENNYIDARYGLRALAALSSRLPEVLPQVFQMACEIRLFCEENMSAIAANLSNKLVDEALQIAREIQDESRRAAALCALASKLPKHLMLDVIQMAQEFENELYCCEVLEALFRHLPESLLPRAFQAAIEIKDVSRRGHTIWGVISLYDSPKRWSSSIVPKALQAAKLIDNGESRIEAIRHLLPYLPDSLLEDALQAVLDLEPEHRHRLHGVSNLAPRLSKPLLLEALQGLQTIGDKEVCSFVLGRLVNNLPDADIQGELANLEPFTISQEVSIFDEINELISSKTAEMASTTSQLAEYKKNLSVEALKLFESAELLEVIIYYTPNVLFEKYPFLLELEEEEFEEKFTDAFSEILESNPEMPKSLLKQAINAVQTLEERTQPHALEDLAPYLSDSLFSKALQVVQSIDNDDCRHDALKKLVPYLPEVFLSDALQISLKFEQDWIKVSVLSAFAPYLTDDLLPKALQATLQISQRQRRGVSISEVLEGLVPKLSEPLIREAFEAIIQIEDKDHCSDAICSLVSKLPSDLLFKACQSVKGFETSDQDSFIDAIAASATEIQTNTLFSIWQDFLRLRYLQDRRILLEYFYRTAPVIIALGGKEAVREAIQAIKVVTKWWP